MQITDIQVSQRKLRSIEQIPQMIKTIEEDEPLPAILLNSCEDGVIQVEDGHHRLVAYWLTGRTTLRFGEYLLIEKDRHRPRFGSVVDLMKRCKLLE